MVPYRNRRADLLSAKEIHAYLQRNDIALLPVGCFEMHGPHIPVACDAYEEWAMALLLANNWDALVLPPVFYTYPGFTAKWPGTIDIDSDASARYIKQILLSLFRGGFKRVAVCCAHYPMRPVLTTLVQEIFLETRNVTMHLNLIPALIPNEATQKAFGMDWGEDLLLLGSLRILGLHGAYDPKADADLPRTCANEGEKEFVPFKDSVTLPHLFQDDYRHTGIRPGIRLDQADTVVTIMKEAARQFDSLPSKFTRYRKELEGLLHSQPWNHPDWSE